MSEERDFADEPERLSELYKAVQSGDASAALDAAAEVTTWDFSHNQVSWIIMIGLLYALASLTRRWQPLLQPLFDAMGEHLKPKQKGPTVEK